MEKIYACKNDCMLYWKDNIDLDYCNFCGEARYKPTRERNPNRKKTQYAILRQFLPLNHPYRGNKKAFTKNRVERKVACLRLTGEHIRDWVEEFSPVVEVPLSFPDGYGSEHNWTKKSIFWELQY
ncbi:UNVERIFIED_CONTAM: hypothetical protein Sradi_2626700 [Sesamum radiatum]|uniref:Uncharacterized protein n=1 Tax=Sesamum radiatum TaxID=300843 RepID=A0AAW2S4P7_SESRA